MKPFIITLTGPSASGKSYVIHQIKDVAEDFVGFLPINFPKYTTREYRVEEILQKRNGEIPDVVSVDEIPSKCDLVYGTYGKEYGLDTKDLQEKLNHGISPLVVVNDVRAVEELKKVFKGDVLSLFIFRRIPSFRETKKLCNERGNVSDEEIFQRYLKATSLYRIYIENITIFDKVILNVEDASDEKNYTKLQITNVLKGVFEGRISLNKNVTEKPKLFIISGNSASGKDDIIQGVRKMGKLQAEIIPKHTSRQQANDDRDEMICRLIPKDEIIEKLEEEYYNERSKVEAIYNKKPSQTFKELCSDKYNEENITEDFDDFCEIQWNVARLKSLREIDKPMVNFWKKYNSSRDSFQLNNNYIDLDKLISNYCDKYDKKQKKDELCYAIKNSEIDFIYVNHGKDKDGITYGFSLKNLLSNMRKDNKHRVLVASLINIFEYCNEKIGRENVVPVFSYSQISKEDFEKDVKSEVDKCKKIRTFNSYLKKYSENIVEFEHVIIYAETQMHNKTGGQKEELIDQIFRLFKAYNSEIYVKK